MRKELAVLALVGVLAACEDDAGVHEPAAALLEEEADDVATGMSDMIYADMEAEFGVVMAGPDASPADSSVITRTFDHVRDCPRGGSVQVEGTTVAVIDRETMHSVIETEATRTPTDCVLPLRRQDRLIELDGAPSIAMSARFEREDHMPVGPQTVSIEGAFDWQILETDRTGTCEIDLDIAWERTAAGGHKTVDGVVCGREIHSETSWTRETDG